LLLFVCGLVSASRPAFLAVLKIPLTLTKIVQREFKGLVFYHPNYVKLERQAQELGLLKQQLNEFKEISIENERLRQLVSFKEKEQYKVLPARIIARCPDSWSSCIIIDKGRSSGVKKGMAVITPDGLVGRIAEVSTAGAKAVLINDPNLNVSAIIQRSRQIGRPEQREFKAKSHHRQLTQSVSCPCPQGMSIGTHTRICTCDPSSALHPLAHAMHFRHTPSRIESQMPL
jgi:cell shape-determining protein MreC